MKFVALVSGGKDSFYSIMECIRNGHQLLACAHLAPRKQISKEGEEQEESYMYQTAASEAIPSLVEECLGVPLMIRQCEGRSEKTALVYDHDGDGENAQDEVEDLYELLIEVQRRFPEVQGISSGAILSTYQRTRIESVCARLNLTPLGYLWRSGTQRDLLECMLKDGIEAVLVKVASPPGLMPQKHLNKSLGQLFYGGVFDRLKEKFDFHICGEGGEYETLVLDCPLFRKRLCLSEVEIVETDDGVGVLRVLKYYAIDKDTALSWTEKGDLLYERIRPTEQCDFEERNENVPITKTVTLPVLLKTETRQFLTLPHVKILSGGLAHVSEIMSQTVPRISDLDILSDHSSGDHEADLAVLETKCIFETLQSTLSSLNWIGSGQNRYCDGHAATAKDVVFVHIYLSSISHFEKINKHYQEFFGIVLPPSRSCVAIGENVLPGGRRVMLDCIIQRGSGAYMRIQPEQNLDSLHALLPKKNAEFIMIQKMNPHHVLRSILHVQTISHWAPTCVGPYSQGNMLRSSLIFLAGQIGLVPGTMTLIDGGWANELAQCWKNAASVLDALDSSLENILGAVVYVSSEVFRKEQDRLWEKLDRICTKEMMNNGGVVSGKIDERKPMKSEEQYGGYEDYETWKAMTVPAENEETDVSSDQHVTFPPLLIIVLPQMPKGASSEVELICASNRAARCLDIEDADVSSKEFIAQDEEDNNKFGQIVWDLGYDSNCSSFEKSHLNDFRIHSTVRSIGKGCAAIANTIAHCCDVECADNDHQVSFCVAPILQKMIEASMKAIAQKSELNTLYALHVRLFYSISILRGCDPFVLRSALHAAITAEFSFEESAGRNQLNHNPACSVIPVDALFISHMPSSTQSMIPNSPIFGMQIIVADLVHTETEMWIHHNRTYN